MNHKWQELYKGSELVKGGKNIPLSPYDPDADLIMAVNTAIFLGRPLLVRGKPGTGKSRLAESIAYELHIENYKENLFIWNIKSSSKAQDGLYEIDVLRRLQDAQFKGKNGTDTEGGIDPTGEKYFKEGALFKAFVKSWEGSGKKAKPEEAKPPVVLLDEIDKADLDFSNDLLQEIENFYIEIPEGIDVTKRVKKYLKAEEDVKNCLAYNKPTENGRYTISANPELKPIIIITSNDERELSDAFLRRCVFYYIELPGREKLNKIATNYLSYSGVRSPNPKLIEALVDKFLEIKQEMERHSAEKLPYTSEMLDWIYLMDSKYTSPEDLKAKLKEGAPHQEVLLKTADDWEKQKSGKFNFKS